MSEMQANPSVSVAALAKEITRIQKELKDLQTRVRQSEKVIPNILAIHGSKDLLPPEELRLHVGTTTSAINFYAQGANSARAVVETFGIEPRAPVLDWGCGSGRTLNWLQTLPAWREHYAGCDVDPAAIDWLRRAGVNSVAVCNDDPPLPYPDASFDGLFCFSVLTHIHPDYHARWYAEMARVLRRCCY
jgi:SAM-dependent methyltransferase